MDDKLFVIAIGGTGMRCLESFVHLCAIGMFDNQEINVLTLDTDQGNGNKGHVEQLIDLYTEVRSDDSKGDGRPNANTFFSAKIKLFRFYTDYGDSENRNNYALLSSVNNLSSEQVQDNHDIADLFFDRDSVQQFDLAHGYRAQTHLGSMLMYHGILESAIRYHKDAKTALPQDKNLIDFISKLKEAETQSARVFVFGSIFGGTGASSIPVIPKALDEATKTIFDGNGLSFDKIKFGTTLLTDYFTFNAPSDAQKSNDKVIADANNFALNSQAALQFYVNDPTVKANYKRLYHIGWPLDKINVSKGKDKVVTGGNEQKNDCHVVELLAASAAYDFLAAKEITENEATYFFKAVTEDENKQLALTGKSFVGEKGDIFENKLGAMLSFAHLALSSHGGAFGGEGTVGLLERLDRQKIYDYNDITDDQAKKIDEYLKQFAYNIVKGELKKGWLYQICESVPGAFIFRSEALTSSTSELRKVDPGYIFNDDRHNWDKSFISSRYDKFISSLVSSDCFPTENQNVQTTKEKFLAHIYNGITIAQHFN